MSRAARGTSPPPVRGQRLHALVAFESLVGDTDQIASAVVDGLDGDFDSAVADIRDVAPAVVADYNLIVTGQPSQMFGLETHEPDSGFVVDRVGMKEWLTNLPEAHERQFCACFDTSTPPGTYGGDVASVNSIRTLHELGYVALSRQTFHVASIGGALLAGELDRAKAWANSLAARMPPP